MSSGAASNRVLVFLVFFRFSVSINEVEPSFFLQPFAISFFSFPRVKEWDIPAGRKAFLYASSCLSATPFPVLFQFFVFRMDIRLLTLRTKTLFFFGR